MAPPAIAAPAIPEALSSGLLLDDTAEHPAPPRKSAPQPISSSSLVEDPVSSPDLAFEDEEAPPLAAMPRNTNVRFPPAAAMAPTAPFPRYDAAFAPTAPFAAAPSPPVPSPAPAPVMMHPPPAAFAPTAALREPDLGYAPTVPFAQPDPFAPTMPFPEAREAAGPWEPVHPSPAPEMPFYPSGHDAGAPLPAGLPAFDAIAVSDASAYADASEAVPTLRRPRPLAIPPAEPPKWLMPVLALAAAATMAVGVGVVAYGIKWMHGKVEEQEMASAPSTPRGPSSERVTAPPANGATLSDPGVARESKGSLELTGGAACILAGAPHIVAPRALLKTGIETTSTADRIALGVGLGERDGFAAALDPSTFAVVDSTRQRASAALRRVVPLLDHAGMASAFLETVHRSGSLDAARPVPGDGAFVLGESQGNIVWAATPKAAPAPLWPLSTDGPVDAIRAVALPEHGGYAIAFRQGGSMFLGAIRQDKTVTGELVRIPGLGPQIGAPTLAAGADRVLVAWADRANASDPWSIRWLTWRIGNEPSTPLPFPIPAGGSGNQAMSPALASIAGGRFVIAWTEGAGARHEVRAEALDARGQPVGTALTVSADGINAGEGTPALTPDGRGAIVFLASPTGSTASVVAVPILCPAAG